MNIKRKNKWNAYLLRVGQPALLLRPEGGGMRVSGQQCIPDCGQEKYKKILLDGSDNNHLASAECCCAASNTDYLSLGN